MDIAVCDLSVVLPLHAKVLNQIEGHTQGLLGVLGIAVGESKNSYDSLPVRGLQISAAFQETIGRVANKFSHGARESRRPGILCEFIFVSDIASYDTHFVCFWMSLERNCPISDTVEFFL